MPVYAIQCRMQSDNRINQKKICHTTKATIDICIQIELYAIDCGRLNYITIFYGSLLSEFFFYVFFCVSVRLCVYEFVQMPRMNKTNDKNNNWFIFNSNPFWMDIAHIKCKFLHDNHKS